MLSYGALEAHTAHASCGCCTFHHNDFRLPLADGETPAWQVASRAAFRPAPALPSWCLHQSSASTRRATNSGLSSRAALTAGPERAPLPGKPGYKATQRAVRACCQYLSNHPVMPCPASHCPNCSLSGNSGRRVMGQFPFVQCPPRVTLLARHL